MESRPGSRPGSLAKSNEHLGEDLLNLVPDDDAAAAHADFDPATGATEAPTGVVLEKRPSVSGKRDSEQKRAGAERHSSSQNAAAERNSFSQNAAEKAKLKRQARGLGQKGQEEDGVVAEGVAEGDRNGLRVPFLRRGLGNDAAIAAGEELYKRMRELPDVDEVFEDSLEGKRTQLSNLLAYLDECVAAMERRGGPIRAIGSVEDEAVQNLKAYSKEVKAKMNSGYFGRIVRGYDFWPMNAQKVKDHATLVHVMIYKLKMLEPVQNHENDFEQKDEGNLQVVKMEVGERLAKSLAKSEKWKVIGAFALGALGALTLLVAVATVTALILNPYVGVPLGLAAIAKFGAEASVVSGLYFAAEFIYFAKKKYEQYKQFSMGVDVDVAYANSIRQPSEPEVAVPSTRQRVLNFLRANKPSKTQVVVGAGSAALLAAPAGVAAVGAISAELAVLPTSVAITSGITGTTLGTAVGTAEVVGATTIPAAQALAGLGMMHRACSFFVKAYRGDGDKMRVAAEKVLLLERYNAAGGNPSQVSDKGSVNGPGDDHPAANASISSHRRAERR